MKTDLTLWEPYQGRCLDCGFLTNWVVKGWGTYINQIKGGARKFFFKNSESAE